MPSDRRGPHLRKLYYSIGEVSEQFAVPAHVLRYWEQEFPQLRPKKSKSGNRLYQEKDLRTIERIKNLLYEKRFTIAGARSQISLLEDDPSILEPEAPDQQNLLDATNGHAEHSELLTEVKRELHEILKLLK